MEPSARRTKYYKYALGRGLSHEDAEDFAQEAFLRHFLCETELNPSWVLADYFRGKNGHPKSYKGKALFISLDEEKGDSFSLHETIPHREWFEPLRMARILAEEAFERETPFWRVVWNLKRYLGLIKPGKRPKKKSTS